MQQKATLGTLSAKQGTFLRELLGAPTIEQAAERAGIHRATAHRWLKEPLFLDAYRTARRELLQATTVRLQQAAVKAAETLETIATSELAVASTRVSASKAILDSAWRATEQEEVIARLEAVERRFEEEGLPPA
jgi:hypothetical protein